MLRFLRIRRLAVIDSVEVEFDPGLNVLTGETGAGKSILVEAVGLLLGGRASADLVRTGEDAATIEALFEHRGDEILVRREITAQGRSRAYVNGELATAGTLKELASRLIELHGQHEHQTLLDPATHLPMLDAFGALDQRVEALATAFATFTAARQELERVRKARAARETRLDLVTFQLTELERAALLPGEDEQLAATRHVLASAERIERLCGDAYALLHEQDQSVLASLGQVWRRVGELATLDPQWQPYLDAKDGIKAQLDDLADYLRHYADGIDASPEALQQAEERLALLERLKRKHGPSLAEVIATRDALRLELADLEGGDERVTELERVCAAAREVYLREARAVSAERRRVAADFARQLEGAVAALALESTRAEIRFGPELAEGQWTAGGIDQAEFYISTNPGEELRPLARIVSGGELSRIMLAVKTLTSGNRQALADAAGRPPGVEAPGLIFDEVDAGIGGRVADMVGRRLRALGARSQVLCITHLPQIAAYADTHFQIVKRVDDGRTRTTVTRLDAAARVDEIGRMLGGEAITAGLRASAEEMINSRRGVAAGAKGEQAPKGESESAGRRKRIGK